MFDSLRVHDTSIPSPTDLPQPPNNRSGHEIRSVNRYISDTRMPRSEAKGVYRVMERRAKITERGLAPSSKMETELLN